MLWGKEASAEAISEKPSRKPLQHGVHKSFSIKYESGRHRAELLISYMPFAFNIQELYHLFGRKDCALKNCSLTKL